MKRVVKIIIISLVILGIALYGWYAYTTTHKSAKSPASSTTATLDKKSAADTLLRLVNEQRKKANVPELTYDAKVAESAQWKVDDMLKFNYLGYQKPGDKDANGIKKLFELTGDSCAYGNEIMVWDSNKVELTPDAAVNWWMSSESHRTTMLDKGYTKTGFGVANYIVVEHFCQPQ